eukprot:2265485-Prymnesium_polylepis.1
MEQLCTCSTDAPRVRAAARCARRIAPLGGERAGVSSASRAWVGKGHRAVRTWSAHQRGVTAARRFEEDA